MVHITPVVHLPRLSLYHVQIRMKINALGVQCVQEASMSLAETSNAEKVPSDREPRTRKPLNSDLPESRDAARGRKLQNRPDLPRPHHLDPNSGALLVFFFFFFGLYLFLSVRTLTTESESVRRDGGVKNEKEKREKSRGEA